MATPDDIANARALQRAISLKLDRQRATQDQTQKELQAIETYIRSLETQKK